VSEPQSQAPPEALEQAAPTPPPAPRPAPGRLDGARLRIKQAGWALAIAMGALFGWALVAETVAEWVTALVPHLAASPEGRAAVATLLVGLGAGVVALVVALLAGLVTDLPLIAGALGGLGALLLPVALPWMFEPPEESLAVLQAARVAALLLGTGAGVAGLLLARRILARKRPVG
jgi:hypothetical protein